MRLAITEKPSRGCISPIYTVGHKSMPLYFGPWMPYFLVDFLHFLCQWKEEWILMRLRCVWYRVWATVVHISTWYSDQEDRRRYHIHVCCWQLQCWLARHAAAAADAGFSGDALGWSWSAVRLQCQGQQVGYVYRMSLLTSSRIITNFHACPTT